MDAPRFLSGKLLLAMPGIGDPRFERAVIAMCVHDENGAVGIGIGHQRAGIRCSRTPGAVGTRSRRGTRRTGAPRRPGGAGEGLRPAQRRLGRPGHIAVTGLGALTGTIDVLKAIAEGKGPSRYLVALGYAGWGEGQLDEEMTRPGWFAAEGQRIIVRHRDSRSMGSRFQGRGHRSALAGERGRGGLKVPGTPGINI